MTRQFTVHAKKTTGQPAQSTKVNWTKKWVKMKLVSVKNPRRVHKSVNAVSRVQAKERMERQHTELTTAREICKKSSNVHVCMYALFQILQH